MKKPATFVAVFMLSLLIASTVGAVTFNSANTVIVLPTTKIVNGMPLHIGEDAIAGSRLGAFLVLKGITIRPQYKIAEVPVEYHSVLIEDNNQTYVLTSRDMPDLGLPFGVEPIGKTIVFRVNFSKVWYNSTKHAAEFLDRSVEIVFNENTTPLNVKGDYKVVYDTVNGTDYMYFYSFLSGSGNMSSLYESVTFGDWKIYFWSININQSSALVDITYPSGEHKLKPMQKGKYYLMYLDAEGNEDYEEYDSYPSTRVSELLKDGVEQLLVFAPVDFFVGVNEVRSIIYNYWFYDKVREYHDGEVYEGQWVWDIDPQNNIYTLYLHTNASASFKPVFVGPGSSLEIPIKEWHLSIVPVFNRTENGGVVVGVLGYRFVRKRILKEKIKVSVPSLVATTDVYSFIINDTALTQLPKDKNVIIVGGWVSNKAWKLLEQVYGKDRISELKERVMRNGYVVEKLPNPYNPNYRVVILAGKTHRETAEAVREFIKGI